MHRLSRGFQWGFSVSSQRININQMGTHKSASAPSASPRWISRVWFVMHRQVAKYAEREYESKGTHKSASAPSASPRWMSRVWFVMHRQVAKYAEREYESKGTHKSASAPSASTAKASLKSAVNTFHSYFWMYTANLDNAPAWVADFNEALALVRKE